MNNDKISIRKDDYTYCRDISETITLQIPLRKINPSVAYIFYLFTDKNKNGKAISTDRYFVNLVLFIHIICVYYSLYTYIFSKMFCLEIILHLVY